MSTILLGRGLGVPVGAAYRITEVVIESLAKHGRSLPEPGTQERSEYIEIVKRGVSRECAHYFIEMRGDIWPDHYDIYAKMLSNSEALFTVALESDAPFDSEMTNLFIDSAQKTLSMSQVLQNLCNQKHYEEVKNMAEQVIKKFSPAD
jgi:hypothetical protein